MSDIVEIPVPVTLPAWRLSKRGNLWLDTGDLLATCCCAVRGFGRGECCAKARRVARSLGSGG
jgi:hypothetical protein